MPRRSKPLLIAPLIPFLGLLGLLGLDRFHGTPYVHAVVGVWCALMLTLTVYVIRQMLTARRMQKGTR